MDRFLAWFGIGSFGSLDAAGKVLALIAFATLGLFLVAVAFALFVVLLRTGHVRAARRRATLHEKWHDALLDVLDVLGGDGDPASLRTRIMPGEELEFLAFLMPFARRVRGDEAELLRRVAAPALPRLAAELRSPSPEQRAFAIELIALFGARRHVADVVRALDDPSPYVAMTAAQALARPEHAGHAEAVVKRIRRFTSWSAAFVSGMLARLGDPVVPLARALLVDPGETIQVRAIAADVLVRRNDPVAADLAATVLQGRDVDPAASSGVFQQAALALLAQVGRADHRPVIRHLMDAPDPMARAAAVRAMGAVGSDGDSELLLAAVQDASPHVAQEAARGLLRLGRTDLLAPIARGEGGSSLVARQVLDEARP